MLATATPLPATPADIYNKFDMAPRSKTLSTTVPNKKYALRTCRTCELDGPTTLARRDEKSLSNAAAELLSTEPAMHIDPLYTEAAISTRTEGASTVIWRTTPT